MSGTDPVPLPTEIATLLSEGGSREVDPRLADAVHRTLVADGLAAVNRPCRTCRHRVVNKISGDICLHPLVAPPTHDPVLGRHTRKRVYCRDARKSDHAAGLCGETGRLHDRLGVPAMFEMRAVLRAFRRGMRDI